MARHSSDEDAALWSPNSGGHVYSNESLENMQNDERSGESIRLSPMPDKLDATVTVENLGKPAAKSYVQTWDVLAFIISVICCILATISVSNEYIAWRLRVNNQLIVVGALLSVMNLCLDEVSTRTFLLLEARFGRSTLQNYEGILRKQAFGARVGVFWRTILICTVALPIGLSVAYKQYQLGGTSATVINATAATGSAPLYGIFCLPAFSSDKGQGVTFSMYFNATLPLRTASEPWDNAGREGLEPPLPTRWPQPYGANTLLLSDGSAAMLDVPSFARLAAMRQWLRTGDSANMTANVFGFVARRNKTMAAQDEPAFEAACAEEEMRLGSADMYNYLQLYLLANAATADYSRLWLGFTTTSVTSDSTIPDQCLEFAKNASRYDILRYQCSATWSITRGSIELVDGSCIASPLPSPLQQWVITSSTLLLPLVWPEVLAETMKPFSIQRVGSRWAEPVAATSVAAMIWSATTALVGRGTPPNATALDPYMGYVDGKNWTYADLGMRYEVPDEVVMSIRPTLVRSAWLYVVFAVQPALILAMIVISITLSSTPIGPGFGIVSILAGIEGANLQYLEGASLSGKLRKDAKLDIVPVQEPDGRTSISYRINAARGRARKGRLRRGAVYS